MKIYKFLKSLFAKEVLPHICEFKLINISCSALYNGKYEWCEGCGSMRSPYVLNNKGKLIFRPTIPSSFITKKDGL